MAYQKKIQFYRKIVRPENFMEVLEVIRINSACNMLDIDCICHILNQSRHKIIADYLKNNQDHYDQILEDFEEWKANQPQTSSKSLAQKLADEMGWQVIVD